MHNNAFLVEPITVNYVTKNLYYIVLSCRRHKSKTTSLSEDLVNFRIFNIKQAGQCHVAKTDPDTQLGPYTDISKFFF